MEKTIKEYKCVLRLSIGETVEHSMWATEKSTARKWAAGAAENLVGRLWYRLVTDEQIIERERTVKMPPQRKPVLISGVFGRGMYDRVIQSTNFNIEHE